MKKNHFKILTNLLIFTIIFSPEKHFCFGFNFSPKSRQKRQLSPNFKVIDDFNFDDCASKPEECHN